MSVYKNTTGQKLLLFAFNRTTNEPVTGDAANITCKIRKDHGSATATGTTNPTELERGYYEMPLTQAESNANVIDALPTSATADVQVIGVPGRQWTSDANRGVSSPAALPAAAAAASGGLPTVGTGSGQVNPSGGKVPATVAEADVSGNLPANVTQFGGTNGSFTSGRPAVQSVSANVNANVVQWGGSTSGLSSLPDKLQNLVLAMLGKESLDVAWSTAGGYFYAAGDHTSGFQAGQIFVAAGTSDSTYEKAFGIIASVAFVQEGEDPENPGTFETEETRITPQAAAFGQDFSCTLHTMPADHTRAVLSSSQPHYAPATASALSAVATNVTTLINRIGAFTGTGANTILGVLRAMMRKDATLPSDVGGTYAVGTDSLEAQQEAYTTPPTTGAIATQVRNELTVELARMDAAVTSRSTLDGAGVRTAVGLETNDLDAQLDAIKADTGNLVTRITSTLFSGITSLANWLRAGLRKDTADATAKSEINSGGGAYNEATDSQEAIRDRGDAAWTGGGGGGGGAVVIGPVAATVRDVAIASSTGGVVHPLRVFEATKGRFVFQVVDGNGDPIDMTGDEFKFTIHGQDGEVLVEIDSDGDQIELSAGDDEEPDVMDVVTVTTLAADNVDVGVQEYKLRNTSLEAVIATGQYRILPAPTGG